MLRGYSVGFEPSSVPVDDFECGLILLGFLDGTLCRHSALNFSMDKSRKLGWHGFVDSNESFLEVFDDLAKLKMIPPVPKVAVSFN